MAKIAHKTDGVSNEVEVLEFILGQQTFGVNVLKIEAIEQYNPDKVTAIPMAPPEVVGTLLFRERTIPLIDLSVELGIGGLAFPLEQDDSEDQPEEQNRVVLVTEFNNITVAFIADGVNRIHRVTWEHISPMNNVFSNSAVFTGSFNIEGREILIVDMEKFVEDIQPATGQTDLDFQPVEHPKQELRSEIKIMVVEDSSTIRGLISDVLHKGGYTSVTGFNNGQAAYDAIVQWQKECQDEGTGFSEKLNFVISDIEMPQMNGLTLCRNIKQNLSLPDLPVVMYSTQINTAMEDSCKRVNADAWISKPQVVKLVELIDQLALEKLATG
jgi:two-component system chemotaxis response regulator CheV